ncbi:MAG: 3-oxoacyl-[acyl-carrier-protein] reductase [Rhodospirillales bacterium]|jgi:3-oxoacyl-[acyl-carrier protein] reductase|nr:3-oxoacyl-[acyl-carrier-protein] reductase [Rhodospirillales bacterium]
MFNLTGKRALVTGASGGIGGAIARSLAAAGALVAVSGTREAALSQLAAELGSGAHVLVANLAEPEAAEALVKAAAESLGGLDILVSNAGITRDQLAMRMSDEDWGAVLDINLTAGFRLMRAALRGMMRQRFGRLVAITSVVGATGNAGQANYAASKAGMAGVIKSLAQELASRNITANCVAPGFIDTEMTKDLSEARRQAVLGAIPAGRFGTPQDVAAAVVFFASEEAAYVTGQTLHVNGGLTMI